MRGIDINSDLGRSFGAWAMGDDALMLEVVTSACGASGLAKTVETNADGHLVSRCHSDAVLHDSDLVAQALILRTGREHGGERFRIAQGLPLRIDMKDAVCDVLPAVGKIPRFSSPSGPGIATMDVMKMDTTVAAPSIGILTQRAKAGSGQTAGAVIARIRAGTPA